MRFIAASDALLPSWRTSRFARRGWCQSESPLPIFCVFALRVLRTKESWSPNCQKVLHLPDLHTEANYCNTAVARWRQFCVHRKVGGLHGNSRCYDGFRGKRVVLSNRNPFRSTSCFRRTRSATNIEVVNRGPRWPRNERIVGPW